VAIEILRFAQDDSGTNLHLLMLLLLAMLAAGCEYTPPAFRLGTDGRRMADVPLEKLEAAASTMDELFGTPDQPRVPEEVPLDLAQLCRAAGRPRHDGHGWTAGLWRRHCARCHGLGGDGAGAVAAVLCPYPRDFRPGWFKYTSTAGGAKPARADLLRTLRQGLPGTAMPSFARLEDDQIDALVEYVRYLSLRGEAERLVLQLILDEGEYVPLDPYLVQDDVLAPVIALWSEAETAVVDERTALGSAPDVSEARGRTASLERGRALYAAKEAQCVKCHGPEGRGDGEEWELYDEWNKPKVGVTPAETAALARLFPLPAEQLRARDFHDGVFRGGRRPIDLYWRIHVGLKGTPMPAAGPAPGAEGAFTPEEIWDVVHYVRSLSE